MTLKRLLKNRKGAVMPFVILFLGLFALGFVALVIDAGILYDERKNMVNAADAAALAGAEVLREYEYKAKTPDYINEAIETAKKFAEKNGAELIEDPVVSSDNKTITVKVKKTKNLIFANFLSNNSTTDVTAKAVATWEYVQKTNFMPLFTFDVNYPTGDFETTPITLHAEIAIDPDGTFDNGDAEKTNSYGFVSIGDGNNSENAIMDSINGTKPVGPYSVGEKLDAAPGNRGSSFTKELEQYITTTKNDTFIIPIIRLAGADDYDGDGVSNDDSFLSLNTKTGNSGKFLDNTNTWELPVAFFAYFKVTSISDDNPAIITGYFTGETINSGAIGGSQSNPNPSGVTTATYIKLIK